MRMGLECPRLSCIDGRNDGRADRRGQPRRITCPSFPVQLMQAVPYILTVVLLAGFIGRAVPPKAGGVAYVKEK